MTENSYVLRPPPRMWVRVVFTPAALAAFVGVAGLGVFAAFAPGFLGQVLGIGSPSTVGLVVFAVFAVSSFGEALLERVFGVRALVAGSIGLTAGMGLLALGLTLSSLPFLVMGGILAGLGQGASFRHGLAAINDASRAQPAIVAAQRDGVALPSGVLAAESLTAAAAPGYRHRDIPSPFAVVSASAGVEGDA